MKIEVTSLSTNNTCYQCGNEILAGTKLLRSGDICYCKKCAPHRLLKKIQELKHLIEELQW